MSWTCWTVPGSYSRSDLRRTRPCYQTFDESIPRGSGSVVFKPAKASRRCHRHESGNLGCIHVLHIVRPPSTLFFVKKYVISLFSLVSVCWDSKTAASLTSSPWSWRSVKLWLPWQNQPVGILWLRIVPWAFSPSCAS